MSYEYDRSKDPMLAMDYARSDAPRYSDLRTEIEALQAKVAEGKRLLLEQMSITNERTKLCIELRSKVAELEADAARYRWLKDNLKPRYTGRHIMRTKTPRADYKLGKPENANNFEVEVMRQREVEIYGIAYIGEIEHWDCNAAIDAAMRSEK